MVLYVLQFMAQSTPLGLYAFVTSLMTAKPYKVNRQGHLLNRLSIFMLKRQISGEYMKDY